MLVIRKEQMAVFEAHLTQRFRLQARQHVREEFPAQTKHLTEPALDKAIADGMERARLYDVTSERDILLFVGLNFALGPNFEHDRKLAWAKKILLDKTLEGPARMEAIYRRLAAYENRAAEKDRAP